MLHQLIVYPVEVKINNVIPEQPAKSILVYQRQNLRPDITKHTYFDRKRSFEKNTELREYVWGLKDQDKTFRIRCPIFKRSCGYSPVSKSCNLWLVEKLGTYSFKEKDFVSKYIYEKNTFLEVTLDLINP